MALVPEYIWDAYTRLNAMIFDIRGRIRRLAPSMLPLMDKLVAYIDVALSRMAELDEENTRELFHGIISRWCIFVNPNSVSIKLIRDDPDDPDGDTITDVRIYAKIIDPEPHELPDRLIVIDWLEKRYKHS